MCVIIAFFLAAAATVKGAPKETTGGAHPDTVILVDGEMLIGHLDTADSKQVTFKSDLVGEVKIKWSDIKELRSSQRYAVAEKDMILGRHENIDKVPQGTLAMRDQVLRVTPKPGGSPEQIPVARTSHVLDEVKFIQALERPGLFQNWIGTAAFGSSIVLATQNSRMFTSAVSLSRAIPNVQWMDPDNRTIINFSSSYGKLTQSGEAPVKTSIFHADAERDEYFNRHLYVFGEGAFDHNYSQGLDLQQSVGSGLGWTVVKEEKQELDLKGELNYVRQQFVDAALNQNLIGSNFTERLKQTFAHDILFQQQLGVSPAWNNTNAYSATGSVSLSVPVMKHLSLTVAAIDTFLNNPSPGFRKNSFQAITSIAYTTNPKSQ